MLEETFENDKSTGIVDIKAVPHSPHTSDSEIANVYNPLSRSVTIFWNGKPFDFPPKSSKTLVEVIAWHCAKHLAEVILQEAWEKKLAREVANILLNDREPHLRRGFPLKDLITLQNALIEGQEAVEKLGTFYSENIADQPAPMVKPEIPKEKFICDVCQQEAKSKAGLTAHKRLVHKISKS